jgi:hypothetical protein
MEEGKVRRDVGLLAGALAGFDPFWEKEPAAEALTALIPLLKGEKNGEQRRDAIARLYTIDPGALPQAGIGLPLAVEFRGDGWSRREKALIVRYMKRAGSECMEGPSTGMRYSLRLTRLGDGSVRWAVADSTTGSVVREGAPLLSGRAKPRSARLVQSILEELYAVH